MLYIMKYIDNSVKQIKKKSVLHFIKNKQLWRGNHDFFDSSH